MNPNVKWKVHIRFTSILLKQNPSFCNHMLWFPYVYLTETCRNSFSAVSTNFWAIETVLETARHPLHVPDAMPTEFNQKIAIFRATIPARADAHPRMTQKALAVHATTRKSRLESLLFHVPNPQVGVASRQKHYRVVLIELCPEQFRSLKNSPISQSYNQNDFSMVSSKANHPKNRIFASARSRLYRWIFRFFLHFQVEYAPISTQKLKVSAASIKKCWKIFTQNAKNAIFTQFFNIEKNFRKKVFWSFCKISMSSRSLWRNFSKFRRYRREPAHAISLKFRKKH